MARFSDSKNPKLTVMIQGNTADEVISVIKKTIPQGAEAFCILTESLDPHDKSKESIKRIIDAAEGLDTYMTNYIRSNSQPELSDDRLAEQLLDMARMGAKLIDVRGDIFCRSTDEITQDLYAVKKQKELISEIHQLGAEVLMSTHIFEYRSPERILEIAKLQQSRGVDIAKIVTVANSAKESDDAFMTNFILKNSLNIPFLFLCNGSRCRMHRMLGPMLGSCMYLCLENSKTCGPQPTIEEAKMLRDKLKENNNG